MTEGIMGTETIYDISATRNNGQTQSFEDFKGKVLLIVNVASQCGFTPQYKGLEILFEKYKEQGLVVLGFPCDQFAHQEPGTDDEIKSFCELNFGVTFPLFKKIEVNGDGTHPLYVFLKKRAPGLFNDAIKWNFTKFLVGREGQIVNRFAPTTTPEKLESDVQRQLEA
jgi:glutathione peroxidase